jgi:hypothetical protein
MIAFAKLLLGLNSVGANQMIIQRARERERERPGGQYVVRDTEHMDNSHNLPLSPLGN